MKVKTAAGKFASLQTSQTSKVINFRLKVSFRNSGILF